MCWNTATGGSKRSWWGGGGSSQPRTRRRRLGPPEPFLRILFLGLPLPLASVLSWGRCGFLFLNCVGLETLFSLPHASKSGCSSISAVWQVVECDLSVICQSSRQRTTTYHLGTLAMLGGHGLQPSKNSGGLALWLG